MKKNTLVILLIIPFIIGLLSFVSVVLLNITVATNISGIRTPYNADGEGFKVSETPYLLEATPIMPSDPNAILRDGNNIVWEIENQEDVEDIATITYDEDNDKYYLNAISEGEVTLLCGIENKGIQDLSIRAIIYEDGAIIVTPLRKGNGQQVENTRYFGMYDISYDEVSSEEEIKKTNAEIEVNIQVLGDIQDKTINLESSSDNISFANNVITINGYGDGSGELTLSAGYITDTYTFKIVKDGVNVYNYNDLLMCTNFSKEGEIVVLQTSLGSLKDVYKGESVPIDGNTGIDQGAYKYVPELPLTRIDETENIELFGNYDSAKDTFNFNNELYYTETTYNHKFIDDWNANNPDKQVSTDIKVGIRVQKDFYGNGFSINMNNLCFPNNGTIDKIVRKLMPSEKDYFFGPLAYVTIGSPASEVAFVKAFGQDNAGMLIDGDNITVNDLKIQNIDDNTNKRNYAYVGSVIDIEGKNNTIKNSIITRGKTLIRAFDTDNLLIDNCILFRSGEFSLKVGSNKEVLPDETKDISFEYQGQKFNSSFEDFFRLDNMGLSANTILEQYLGIDENVSGAIPSDILNDCLKLVQDSLINTTGIVDEDGSLNYAATITVNNTQFDESGLFSIAFETRFNGPYLYNGQSSTVNSVVSILETPTPNKIGGTAYPINLKLTGKTRFYDYKDVNNIDVSNLIEENLSAALGSLGDSDLSLTIDDYFPMKPILIDRAKELGYVYYNNDKEYLNTSIAYYGGGVNLSTLDVSNLDSETKNFLSDPISVDLLTDSSGYIDSSNGIALILSRCVLFAAGFEPFKFITNSKVGTETPIYFGEHPDVSTLKQNLQ